jgi:hypothetical protein
MTMLKPGDLFCGAIAGLLLAPVPTGPTPTADEKLVKRVRDAVAKGASPALAEKIVGEKSNIDWSRDDHRGLFMRTDIDRDTSEKEWVANLKAHRTVLLWGRPVESRLAKIVGIAWDEKGNPKLLFGIILDRD